MSQHYEVLARKYRPHNFQELVGQTHTIRTLVNALDNNNLHHGFLFTGTRGVGKTTIARIFAKSVNCEEGVSSTPCVKCPTCLEIDKGQSVDLIELDAASNTGVDHMREILENAQYTPTKNLYKIYLIDEVHMLSKSSFNALLKKLEEPPAPIKFLLATTDPKKLPITVLSRCLQFNLNKLSHEEILNHLKFIMDEEKLKFDESALSKIAEFGNGSMRDALSLLDQSISYGNGSVKEEDLIQNLYVLSSHVQILCFTTKGKVFWLKVYEIPVASRISKGRPLVNMLNLDDDESVSEILPVDEFSDDKYIFMATRKGTTKKTNLSLFAKKYKSGIKAINLDDDDVLIGTAITSGEDEILLASSSGKLIRFSESHVRPMGRTARGVRGIKLKKGEKLISLMLGDPSKTILCVSENGFGKKTNLDDFPSHNRGGQGVISMKTSERNGVMVSSTLVEDDDGIMLISDKGTMIRTSVEQVPTLSRNTQGVKIITPKGGEKLIECVTIPKEDDEDDDQ